MFELNETLWLTADRKRAVKDGDKEAAFLLGRKGSKISDVAAIKLGLTKAEPGKEINHRDPAISNRDLIEPKSEAPKKTLPISAAQVVTGKK